MIDRPSGSGLTLVWDASPLHHAIKADRIDVLGSLAKGTGEGPVRNVTTNAVTQELQAYSLPTAGLTWLEVVHVDGLPELSALVRWMDVVSGQKSNEGEATVLAWAETHHAIPVVDDKRARRAARCAGMEVWSLLRVVAESVRMGSLSELSAERFVDTLIDTGARYPCGRGKFREWAKCNGVL